MKNARIQAKKRAERLAKQKAGAESEPKKEK